MFDPPLGRPWNVHECWRLHVSEHNKEKIVERYVKEYRPALPDAEEFSVEKGPAEPNEFELTGYIIDPAPASRTPG